MSETPRKLAKTTASKPKKDSANDECRFCKTNLKAESGRKPSFENLFKPSGREDSKNLVLADACGIHQQLLHRYFDAVEN